MIEKIIDQAFDLYMPQDRGEITSLAEYIKWHHSLHKKNYTILEIGTKFGGTFHIWNSINPNGINISIDMSDGGLHGGITDEQMDKRDKEFTERFSNCHFIRGDSHLNFTKSFLVNYLKFLTGKEAVIDFLFIDGDHTYEGVKKDFEMYSPFVKKGGVIAFHDIVISDRHHERNVYVGEFWKELTFNRFLSDSSCIYNAQKYKIIEIINGSLDWAGIGCLIK